MNHIALLIPGLERIGGAERQVLLLAHGLHRRGWRVTMVALTGSAGPGGVEMEAEGVGFVSLAMRKGVADPRGWIRLDAWIRRERPDLLHAHLPHATWMARWLRLLHPRLAVVDTLHSTCTGSIARRLGYRASNWLAGQVTAVSVAVAEVYAEAGLVDPAKLSVLPNGVDTEALRPSRDLRLAMRRELGISDEFLWVAVGRLMAVKDYPTLLRAMQLLPDDAKLVVAGDGPLAGELRALAARLGLDGRVRFLGFVPDVGQLLQAADAAVQTSRWEGMPLTLLEAGALALPSVVTDVPGLSQMVLSGETGLLAPVGDPAALAAVMLRLMRMPATERRSMGERARLSIERNYSLEAVLDRWENLYARCCAQLCGKAGPAASSPRFLVESSPQIHHPSQRVQP
jgi:glycosyltransferase involved in cell wall biosynthesis